MKKLFLIYIVLINGTIKSQTIDSVRIANTNAITTLDTVYLNVYGISDYGTVTNTNYSLTANKIKATVNICSGALYTPYPFKSTIKISPLNLGAYKIKVALKNYDGITTPVCTILNSTNYDSLNINVIAPTAIKQNNNVFSLVNVIPNPFQNAIKLNLPPQLNCNIIITDNLGKFIYQKEKYNSNQELDLSFLLDGVYFLKVNSNSQQKVFKIIKN